MNPTDTTESKLGLEAKLEQTFTATVGQILASQESLARLTQEKVSIKLAQQIMHFHTNFGLVGAKFNQDRRHVLSECATLEADKWKFETPIDRAEFNKAVEALAAVKHEFPVSVQLSLDELKACAVKITGGDLERLTFLIDGL